MLDTHLPAVAQRRLALGVGAEAGLGRVVHRACAGGRDESKKENKRE